MKEIKIKDKKIQELQVNVVSLFLKSEAAKNCVCYFVVFVIVFLFFDCFINVMTTPQRVLPGHL